MDQIQIVKFPPRPELLEQVGAGVRDFVMDIVTISRAQAEAAGYVRPGPLPPGIHTASHWDAVLELTQGMLKLVAVPEIHGPPTLWDQHYPSAGPGTHPNQKARIRRGHRPVDPMLETLREQGFNILANGHYGAVIDHGILPEGLVIKVGIDPDDGWPDYARWCRAHPEHWGAGALPVYHLARPARARGAYVAVVPKLRELSSFGRAEQDILHGRAQAWTAMVEVMTNDYTYRNRLDSLVTPKARAFLSDLSSFFRGTVQTDLHIGNFMAAGPDHEPTLIITDPFGWSSNPTYDED